MSETTPATIASTMTETMSGTKFVQFGCWNNVNIVEGKNIGSTKEVMELLNNYVEKEKPNFIVVSGDNYYPNKTKGEKKGEKKKIIIRDKMIEGFRYLPDEIPIYMILGNHDLDTNGEKMSFYIENDATPEGRNECYTLKTEIQSIKENVEYDLFKSKMLNDGTLLMMIDTNMYSTDEDVSLYLPCYQHLKETYNFSSITELRDFQKTIIIKSIDEALATQPIKNIILVGHHPIAFFKIKKGEAKVNCDIPFFTPILKDIYNNFNTKQPGQEVNYYYLCSDLHLYQKGVVTLPIEDKNMRIQQYIVGSGGTELDDPLTTIPDGEIEIDEFKYRIEEEVHDWGFLECIVNESGPTFKPIFLNKRGGSKISKMYTKMYTKKNNKLIKKKKSKTKKKRTQKKRRT
jgi:predicted MPP superfamily phosphohydrolase